LCGVAAAAALVGACGGDSAEVSSPAFDAVVEASKAGRWRSTGDDVVEVWVCRVHPYTPAPLYGGLPLRAPIAASTLTLTFQQAVSRYYHRISHGAYQPVFVAGGDITLGIADDEQDCIDKAIAGSAATTRAVLAVADAEHAPGQPGGMGSGGDATAAEGSVAATRRYAYVGAADFDRVTWGDAPPMDLVEHEIGHTLGWVHSGLSPAGDYLSGVDLMSNSAAPRDVDASRRDGPDVLAIHRVVAGWLPVKDVKVAGDSGLAVTLAASTASTGTRLAVLPVDDTTFLTVEWRDDAGYDDHLPAAGVAVHRVVELEGAIQSIDPVYGTAPFLDLVLPGDTLTADGWTITVATDGRVDAKPAT
jgi:hypothetical protein